MNDWETLGNIAAVASALCCIACTVTCVRIWRKARSFHWADKGAVNQIIIDGDAAVKKHTEAQVSEIRETVEEVRQGVVRIEQVQGERHEQAQEMRQAIARIETDAKYTLRGSSLSPLHEKINELALRQVGAQAKSTAENLALSEQLKLLRRLVEDSLVARNRSNRE